MEGNKDNRFLIGIYCPKAAPLSRKSSIVDLCGAGWRLQAGGELLPGYALQPNSPCFFIKLLVFENCHSGTIAYLSVNNIAL
ncbi:MAG: hypothetical protein ACK5NK_03300 [Niabella sp.]